MQCIRTPQHRLCALHACSKKRNSMRGSAIFKFSWDSEELHGTLQHSLFWGKKKSTHTRKKSTSNSQTDTQNSLVYAQFFFFLAELASLLSIALFRSLRRRVVGASHFFLDSRQSLLVLERGKRVAYDGRWLSLKEAARWRKKTGRAIAGFRPFCRSFIDTVMGERPQKKKKKEQKRVCFPRNSLRGGGETVHTNSAMWLRV